MKKILQILLLILMTTFMMVGCSFSFKKPTLTNEFLLGEWKDPSSLIEFNDDNTFHWNIKNMSINMYGDYKCTEETIVFNITKLSQFGLPAQFENGTSEDTKVLRVKEIKENTLTVYIEEEDTISIIERVVK